MSDNPLVNLLGLEEHARRATNSTELGFVMVNDSRVLAAYRQAALFIEIPCWLVKRVGTGAGTL